MMASWQPGPNPPPIDWQKLGVYVAVVVVGAAFITGVVWGISKATGW